MNNEERDRLEEVFNEAAMQIHPNSRDHDPPEEPDMEAVAMRLMNAPWPVSDTLPTALETTSWKKRKPPKDITRISLGLLRLARIVLYRNLPKRPW